LRRESPVQLAREALWRVQKKWGERRFPEQIAGQDCSVVFQASGYYRPPEHGIPEAAQKAILRYADAVLAGEFPSFSYGPVRLGIPPRWDLDSVSGGDWRARPSNDLQVVRHDGSDVKVPWELSRLQCLPVLGKAWRLTKLPAYRKAAQALLSDWVAKNPAGMGVNWTLAMEAALRAMSVCFLLELLAPFRDDESAWVTSVTRSLWHHLLFIEAHREFSHLIRSNHYLSNLAGLLALSCSLKGPGIATRRHRYARLVQKEILIQTYADGGNHEASLGYHIFCTQLFTTALFFLRACGLTVVPAFEARLHEMYRLIAGVASGKGSAPNVGDCDDGRAELLTEDLRQMFLPIGERTSLVVSGLLGIDAALWGLEPAGTHEDAVWYGLQQAYPRKSLGGGSRTLVFPQSGIAIVRRGEAEVLLFAMPNGIGGRGSHTHNDKLSVIVRLRGVELFTDGGTGCYTRDAAMRNRFRATAAHNTLVVDGVEQNLISPARDALFRLGNEARVTSLEGHGGPDSPSLAATLTLHGTTWRHSRLIKLDRDRAFEVRDSLIGTGTHDVDLYFHLAPGWEVSSMASEESKARCTITGPAHVGIHCAGPAALTAQAEPALQSRTYGTAVDSVRLHIHTKVMFPAEIVTQVRWD
jgi:hypothetical protein